MSDHLFREVDEDLQRERYMRLWQRYGRFLGAGAVGIVALTAAWVGWQQYDLRQRSALSDRFAAAVSMADEDNRAAAVNALEILGAEEAGGYGALANLRAAGLIAEDGDAEAAARLFDTVAADSGAPRWLRDLATILSAQQSLRFVEPADLENRLAPLTADANPWRHSARELTALVAMRAGDRERAIALLQALADDFIAPAAVRARAAEMLAAMQG